MKRLLLYVGVAAVAALALGLAAGCGGGTSSSPSPLASGASHEPVTLTVWHPWTVKSEKQGFATAVTALALGLAAGCGGGTSSSPSPLASGASHEPVTLTVWHPWTVKSE